MQNALRMQKLKFFGTSFLCSCDRPILEKVTKPASGCVEYVSIVQNRVESSSDSDILIESFSDDEVKKDDLEKESSAKSNDVDDSDLKTHSEAAEIRRLRRRKDELERKERMMVKYNERLQVSKLIQDILKLKNLATWNYITQHKTSENEISMSACAKKHRTKISEFIKKKQSTEECKRKRFSAEF